jgi:hypothetical protein
MRDETNNAEPVELQEVIGPQGRLNGGQPRGRVRLRLNRRSRQEHASLIISAWKETLQGIIKVGAHLIDARSELGYREYGLMVSEDLPFSLGTARKLRLIAGNHVLTNRSHANALPVRVHTLYELSQFETETLQALIEDGTVHPKLERGEAKALRTGQPQSAPHQCAFCSDTAKVATDHRWSDDDDRDTDILEEQGDTADLVSNLVDQIEGIFASTRQAKPTLRQKIEQLCHDRVHPDIRGILAEALREHAGIATQLADQLSPVRR